jgi:membrane fusion protein, protease secretion system
MMNEKVLTASMKPTDVEDAMVVGQPDAQQALRKYADTSSVARIGLTVLALGFGGFLLWAALAPLDEGVPTPGSVTIDTKRKTVQHLTGGIIKEVLVREGEIVKEGQVLIRLDESVSKANFETVRQRYLGFSAMKSRLLAEQSGASNIAFDSVVLQAAAIDPNMQQQVNTQQQLFAARKSALQADLQGLTETIAGYKAQLESTQEMLVQRNKQLTILREELASVRDLVRDGYAPKNRQQELERSVADVQSSIADLNGGSIRANRAMAEINQRMIARRSEYRKEIETQLAEASREVQSDAQRYTAQKEDLQRADVRAPASGQVVGLAVQTVGGVLQPGQKLMDIVPKQQELLLEAHIAPHLIDKVRTGLKADIRFNAFSHSPQLVVEGKVLSVSGDLISDPANPQMAHYLARLQVTPDGMRVLGIRQMQPGMPAEVVIKTGERSMLTYLLSPLLKRVAGAMKEE